MHAATKIILPKNTRGEHPNDNYIFKIIRENTIGIWGLLPRRIKLGVFLQINRMGGSKVRTRPNGGGKESGRRFD